MGGGVYILLNQQTPKDTPLNRIYEKIDKGIGRD